MSKAQRMYDQMNDTQTVGAVEAAIEGVKAIAPGLKDIMPEAGAELARLGKQGAAELAAALFSGAAYTPYGEGQRSPGHGVHGPDIEPQKDLPQPQREQDGMSM